MCAHVPVYLDMCVCTHVYIYTWICVCAHRYIFTGVWMCVYMYIYTGVCVGVHTHIYIGVHIDVHIYIHTHTHSGGIPTKIPDTYDSDTNRMSKNSVQFILTLSAVRIKFRKLKGSVPQDSSHFRHQVHVFILLTNWLWIGGSHGSLSGLIISS